MAETATQDPAGATATKTTGTATDAGTTAPPTTGDATGQQQNGGSETEQPKFTQSQLEAVVKDRLERERKRSEQQTAKAREDAEAAALAKNAEWQALAEKRGEQLTAAEAKAAEVDAVNQRAERYETALKAHLDSQRKELPSHIAALLDKLDVVEQLEWIAANRETLTKGANGIPATPKPTDGKAVSEAERQRLQDLARTQTLRMFR